MASSSTRREFDEYQNLVSEETLNESDKGWGLRSLREYTYENRKTEWLVGLRRSATETSETAAGASQTRTTEFEYDALGRPSVKTREPGVPSMRLITEVV